ncbi:MAG: DUF397 domain-containing protein [Umezawaea sp.]
MRTWRKSSYSGTNNDCVEVANALTAVRDSKGPDSQVLEVSRVGLAAFISAVKTGRLR